MERVANYCDAGNTTLFKALIDCTKENMYLLTDCFILSYESYENGRFLNIFVLPFWPGLLRIRDLVFQRDYLGTIKDK